MTRDEARDLSQRILDKKIEALALSKRAKQDYEELVASGKNEYRYNIFRLGQEIDKQEIEVVEAFLRREKFT